MIEVDTVGIVESSPMDVTTKKGLQRAVFPRRVRPNSVTSTRRTRNSTPEVGTRRTGYRYPRIRSHVPGSLRAKYHSLRRTWDMGAASQVDR